MKQFMLQDFTYRIQPIEVFLKNGGNITKFPDQPQLANSIIFRIHALNASDITLSPLTGTTVIAVADFAKASLNFYQGSDNKFNNVSLVCFHDVQNGTPTPFIRKEYTFNRASISWTKSTVQLLNATWSQDQTLVLMVDYAYPEDFGFNTVDEYFNSLQDRPAIEVKNRV